MVEEVAMVREITITVRISTSVVTTRAIQS
jgi:hypothetical protein